MSTFAILLTVAGLTLFFSALAVTLRANPRSRIPFWRNAESVPTGSVALRAIGAGFIVFGAVLSSAGGWWWPLIVVILGPGIALVVIAMHNARVTAS